MLAVDPRTVRPSRKFMDFMFAELMHKQAARCVFNAEFNQAVLFFKDGSYLQFEHTSRDNRWARASAEQTQADKMCQSLRQFRLNAKHLQLFFDDGSEKEFIVSASSQKRKGEMARPGEKKEFESWHQALAENELKPQQLAALQEIVDTGQVESLEAAAKFLDWQESVIDPDEHMYGF